jgi:hypothetical protein
MMEFLVKNLKDGRIMSVDVEINIGRMPDKPDFGAYALYHGHARMAGAAS